MAAASSSSSSKAGYALCDEDYKSWQQASKACKASAEPLKALEALQPRLRNWRSPVTGQTLVQQLAVRGAEEETLCAAERLGCDRADAPAALPSKAASKQRQLPMQLQEAAPPPVPQVRRSRMPWSGLGSASSARSSYASAPSARRSAPEVQLVPAPPVQRKAGKQLRSGEVSKMPKAWLSVNLDMASEQLDACRLEKSIQAAYGGTARVQIDDMESCGRKQKVRARVLFDSERECRVASAQSSAVTTQVAQNMELGSEAVEFDGKAEANGCDALTLKLDSDSSHILCGACLLYNEENSCLGVLCHTVRDFYNGAVRHSGDTRVDGKSVHTIGLVMSQIPPEVTQLFFTICSCGPTDLSGFKDPSIMLYSNKQPEANLLEYSINQAANSVSSVMARMVRQPVWSQGEAAVIARALRKLRMPLLCIDICMAMAAETSFDIQALGTPEWHVSEKVCNAYHHAKEVIERNLTAKAATNSCSVA